MLDLIKLLAQVTALGQHLSHEAGVSQGRLRRALLAYQQAGAQPQDWRQRHEQARLSFAVASPVEPLDPPQGWAQLEPQDEIHTVVATDGSQIMPNHHEIAYCSLINIGRVALHYGSGRRPLLDSVPSLFYRSEELRRGLGAEELLALRRAQLEFEELVQITLAQQDQGPTLALVDGALIPWGLDPVLKEERVLWLEPIWQNLERLRQARIPVAGYISASRSSEMTNYLRLGLCPFERCDCERHCSEETSPPCQGFGPLSDRAFWASLLQPGQRSPVWRSGSVLLEGYGDHHIHACYLHVGEEVVRIEMPGWVATDPELLASTMRILLAQVQKGFGYPVALAEAHHLAVVRGGDRQRFFALLERELVRAGLPNVSVSRKEARKRSGIA